MPFESFEKISPPSAEKGLEKLKNYLERTSQELKEAGFPVNKDCRIDLETFKGKLYSPEIVEGDQKLVEERKKKFEAESWQRLERKKKWYKEIPGNEEERSGAKLEMFTTALFHKFLNEDFYILRSSEYDDIINRVDHLIIEKKTGNPVCAFDEVAGMRGPRYEEKKMKILDRNLKGGVKLKYGIKVEASGEEPKIELAQERHLPVFYLAFPQEELERAIGEFNAAPAKTEEEQKFFAYFLKSIDSQVAALNLEEKKLNPVLRSRLNSFAEKLKEIKI